MNPPRARGYTDGVMAESAVDTQKVRDLIDVMERHGLSGLTLDEDGVSVRIEMEPGATAAAHALRHFTAHHAHAHTQPDEPALPEGIPLVSPISGSFYRAPKPGEPPFVEVGEVIEVGQTIGIIMAMKVMSEIPAEVAGEVVAILPEDAALVDAGETLIIVRPTE